MDEQKETKQPSKQTNQLFCITTTTTKYTQNLICIRVKFCRSINTTEDYFQQTRIRTMVFHWRKQNKKSPRRSLQIQIQSERAYRAGFANLFSGLLSNMDFSNWITFGLWKTKHAHKTHINDESMHVNEDNRRRKRKMKPETQTDMACGTWPNASHSKSAIVQRIFFFFFWLDYVLKIFNWIFNDITLVNVENSSLFAQ